MRLICPNCSAQYEIDGSMIPDEGRDVQCSNCGKTWFELPQPPQDFSALAAPEAEPESVPEEVAAGEESDEGTEDFAPVEEPADDLDFAEVEEAAPEPDDEIVAEEVETETVPEPAPDESEDSSEEDEADDWDWPQTRAVTPPAATPPRRAADEAARDILRQEAEEEMARRRAKASENLETQADLGLEDGDGRETPSRALRARMARLRSDEPQREDINDGYDAPRRDLLPDIDEINSSLNPNRGRRSGDDTAEHQRGFRIGFAAMIALAVILILGYTQAPAIAAALPGAEGAMISYVDWFNGIRDAIGGLLGG